jgi:hypothetical protein
MSGRIKDSDATELWTESRSIREWSAARVKELSDHIAILEARLNEIEEKNYALVEENRRLHSELEYIKWERVNAPRRRRYDPPRR